MSTYRNFEYFATKNPKRWRVCFPSNWTTFINADTEVALQTKIDELIAMFEG